MDVLEDSDAPAASRPNTVEDSGLGGHTYLPGTASLVQEIDSKFKEAMLSQSRVTTFTNYCCVFLLMYYCYKLSRCPH